MNRVRTLLVIVLLTMLSVACVATDLKVVDICFIDDSHGWLSVVDPSPALYKTTNGGQSWERIESPGFFRIIFFDPMNGVAIKGELNVFKFVRGEFGIFRTADG